MTLKIRNGVLVFVWTGQPWVEVHKDGVFVCERLYLNKKGKLTPAQEQCVSFPPSEGIMRKAIFSWESEKKIHHLALLNKGFLAI